MKGFSTPQEFINSLTWYGKAKKYSRNNQFDVTITNNTSGANITFRNDTFKWFKSGTIKISVSKDSVIFMDGGKDGIKLSATNNPNIKVARFNSKPVEGLLRTFNGDYEMKYFKQFGLYYVTKGEEDDE